MNDAADMKMKSTNTGSLGKPLHQLLIPGNTANKQGCKHSQQIRNNLKIPRIRRQAQGLVWGCVPDAGRYFRHGYIKSAVAGWQLIMCDVGVARPRHYFGFNLDDFTFDFLNFSQTVTIIVESALGSSRCPLHLNYK